jgi:hypothetical protein
MPAEDTQADRQAWAPLTEVAAAYGVSIDTIRRRMRKGELEGRREQTPQGFRWLALMPAQDERQNASNAPESPESHEPPVRDLDVLQHQHDELIDTLRHELALRNREISRLHEVIASQAIALQHQTQVLAASTTSKQEHQEPLEREPAPSPPVDQTPVAKPSPGTWARFLGWFRGGSAE